MLISRYGNKPNFFLEPGAIHFKNLLFRLVFLDERAVFFEQMRD
jgi:hypothetical protein